MSTVERAFAGQRLFVEVPMGLTDWVPAVEVLLQEGLRALAFHVDEVGRLAEALALFGRRARLGAWGALTPRAVSDAVGAGAHFVTSPIGDPRLAAAAGETPYLPGGLTPSELVAAVGDVVQVVPADTMPIIYARSLRPLIGGRQFVATGRLEPYQCTMWAEAGAAAIGLSGDSLVDQGGSVDLGKLRTRCRSYVEAVARP